MTRSRKILGVIAAAVCSLACVFGSLALRTKLRRCPHYLQGLVRRTILHKDTADRNTEFRWFMSATQRTPTGLYIDVSVYQSQDCVEVSTGYTKLDTPTAAAAEFERTLKMAHRVYERTPTSGSGGAVTGERAVAQVTPGQYLILNRAGNEISTISSTSLSYATEFEKRALPGHRLGSDPRLGNLPSFVNGRGRGAASTPSGVLCPTPRPEVR